MPLPDEGPCGPWCTWADVVRCVPDDVAEQLNEIPEPVREALIAEASETLYLLDGERMPGVCSATRTFCRRCSCGLPSCCCRDRGRDLDLGATWPADEVLEVVLDGEILTPQVDWRVDDWRWLVRLVDGVVDPSVSWPTCADLADPDSLTVTWTFGRAVTVGAVRAAAALAVEPAKACVDLECQIPERVTVINREGLTFTIIDSFKMLEEGKTGFYAPDRWLAARRWARSHPAPGGVDPAMDCTTRSAIGTDAGGS